MMFVDTYLANIMVCQCILRTHCIVHIINTVASLYDTFDVVLTFLLEKAELMKSND